MEKCLITKLKGTVTNNNPFYDAIRMFIKWGDNSSFAIKANGPLTNLYFGGIGTTIKVIDNGTIKVGNDNVGTEYTITSNSTSTIDIIPSDTSVDTQIILKNLQSITYWGRGTSAHQRLAYSDDQSLLLGSAVTGSSLSLLGGYFEPCDISVLADIPNKANVTSVYLNNASGVYKGDIHYFSELPSLVSAQNLLSQNNPGIYGDIAAFLNNTVIQNIELRRNDRIVGMLDNLAGCSALKTIDLQSTSITGNIASIGACTQLTSVVVASTSVTGTVEDLVAAFNSAGKTSGSISIGFTRTGITYNGAQVSGTTLTWSGTNITIS